MVEFTTEPQKAFNPITIIAACLVALFLGGIGIYVHYQKKAGPQQKAASVFVAGLLEPGNTDFEYYKTRVKLENVKATLGISISKARIAMIEGEIVNDGDRKLEALQLHVTLRDVWGKLSKERTAFALRPGAGLSGRAMEPLERRPFTIGVESVEYYWDPKQVTCEITGLKYR
jgi:hypothetical protein